MSDSSLEIIDVDELEPEGVFNPNTCSGLSDDSLSASLANSLNNFYSADDNNDDRNDSGDDISSPVTPEEKCIGFCEEEIPRSTKSSKSELSSAPLLSDAIASTEVESSFTPEVVPKLSESDGNELGTSSKMLPENAAGHHPCDYQTPLGLRKCRYKVQVTSSKIAPEKYQVRLGCRKNHYKLHRGLFRKRSKSNAAGDNEESKQCVSEEHKKNTEQTICPDKHDELSHGKDNDTDTALGTQITENIGESSSKVEYNPGATEHEVTSTYSLLEYDSQTSISTEPLEFQKYEKNCDLLSSKEGLNYSMKAEEFPKDFTHGKFMKDLKNFACQFHKLNSDLLNDSFTEQNTANFDYCNDQDNNFSQSSSFFEDREGNTEVGREAGCYSKELLPVRTRPKSSYALRTTKVPHGFFYWLQNVSFLRKFTRHAKSTLNFVISTLDPGMPNFIEPEPDLSISVITTNPQVAAVVKNAFEKTFPHMQNIDIRSLPVKFQSLPKESLGFESGLLSAEAKVDYARKRHLVPQKGIVVTIAPILVEITPLRWHSCACILLDDPNTKLSLHAYTQTTPVPNEYVEQAQLRTPDDYSPHQTGLSITVGDVMSVLIGIPSNDWQKTMTDVSCYSALENGTRALAGMYKRYLEGWNSSSTPFE